MPAKHHGTSGREWETEYNLCEQAMSLISDGPEPHHNVAGHHYKHGSVCSAVEQWSFKPTVVGSIPTGLTKFRASLVQWIGCIPAKDTI